MKPRQCPGLRFCGVANLRRSEVVRPHFIRAARSIDADPERCSAVTPILGRRQSALDMNLNPFAWPFRAQYFAGFVVCAALLAFAYYVQFDLGIERCPL